MKQRLGIAVALVHNPRLIILDEPTNGLDPQGIADIRNLILRLSHEQRKTVLVSSHLLKEMEIIANRMLIIDRGQKVVEGEVRALFDPSRMLVELETQEPEKTIRVIQGSAWKACMRKQTNGVLFFEMDKNIIPDLARDLVENQVRILRLEARHSLEEYFLSLTTPARHVDPVTN